MRRGGKAGPILVGLLCVFELVSFPSWDRNGAGEWIFQIAFISVAVLALLQALVILARKPTLT